MKVFKTKTDIANYLWVSRPTIDLRIRDKEVKQIVIWKSKWYVVVREFIIYLLS